MKRLFAIACIAQAAGLALAQTVSTPGKSALYSGNGTGTAKKVYAPPDAQTQCRAGARIAPGKWMCKEEIATVCAPAAASSVQTVQCAAPLVGSYQVTTRYVVSTATCVQTPTVSPTSPPTGACNPVPPPPVPEPPPAPVTMPISKYVPITDASKWPKLTQRPVGGWSTDMLIPTSEVAPSSDIGAFRTGCQAVMFGFFDPIVYPGQPGKSHLHTFFGNTGINASSTSASLFGGGNSTCRGGTINRSAYWVPSMVDMRSGLPMAPMFESNFYYKTGYAVSPSAISEVPLGLRMIAGDATGNPSKPSNAAIYACVWQGGNSNWQNSIPKDCKAVGDSWLIMGIDFPQCWDGVNLDSPDHKSHMTNPINVKANNTGNCPASHPVALPQIAYQVLYQVKVSGETAFWRLASDNYDNTLPAGYSGHGDYWMAWKPDIVKAWTKNCDNAQKDCHSHLLGDGRAMVIP